MKNNSVIDAIRRAAYLAAAVFAVVLTASAGRSWLATVPDSYRQKVNPYAGQADAIAAGGRLFAEHCAPCHQSDALGRGKRPSLRTGYIQNAKDGELYWVLRNGILAHGMPSWSFVPDESRWQIIAYLKSLGPADASAPVATTKGTKK
jgi:mono/diheme cytochrome c family protein